MPRKPLTNTGRVVLGMIAEGHGTGYAIKAEIERSTRLYWGASVGGIYPELRRLQQEGLVIASDDYRGEMPRHAYELTDEGRAALHEWLADPCEPALEMRNEALLRLRFAGVLPEAEQLELVRRMGACHERRASDMAERLATEEFDDPLHRLVMEFSAGWNTWASGWCREVEERLRGTAAAPARA